MGVLYNIRAKIGEYEKDGETKGKYATIGVVIETKNGKTIKLDTIPVNWEGFAYLSEPLPPKEAGGAGRGSESVVDDIDDEPVDLSSLDVPF